MLNKKIERGKIMFKVNEGPVDRIIRIILGIILLVSGILSKGVLSLVLIILGVVGIFTGITGFCGLYMLLGISTKK